MEPLAFFLLGLPLAYLGSYLIVRLTDFEEDEAEDGDEAVPPEPATGKPAAVDAARPEATHVAGAVPDAERTLPWQKQPWPDRVRWGVVAMLPVFMAVAGSRFDVAEALLVSLLLGALLVCTATDLLRYRVPNAITYPSIVLALIAAAVMPDGDLLGAVLAALLAGGIFLVLAVVTRGGLGFGDVKLAVLIGAMLGLPAGVQSLFLGVIAGGAVIFALFVAGVVGRRQAVPYAPFLAAAAIVVTLVQGAAFAPL